MNPPPPDRRFAIFVTLGTVLLFVVYRLVVGAGLGFGAGTASGILEFPEDNFAYVSYLEQVRAGVFPFVNAFAGGMEQGQIYANPLFLALGLICSWTGLSALGVYVTAGLIATAVTVFTIQRIARDAGLDRMTARIAAVLTAFGSGISAIISMAAGPGQHEWMGVDRTHQDAIAFSTFAVYPFQAMTLAILALWIHSLVRRNRIGIACFGLLSALSRPYESMLCLATYTAFAAFSRVGDQRRRLTNAGIGIAVVAPAIGYAFWVSRQPAWLEYSTTTIAQIDINPRAWLTGYGVFLPAAVLGFFAERRQGETGTRNWFALWVALLLILLVALDMDQVKLASGAQLPLAVLAARGCTTMIGRCRDSDIPMVRYGMRVVVLATATLFVATSAHLCLNVYQPHHLPAGLRDVAERIRTSQSDDNPLPLVLCDREIGTVLPGLVGCRVYAGHWSMTPSRTGRVSALYMAGIDDDALLLRDPASSPPSADALDVLTTHLSPDLLLLRESSPAKRWMDAAADRWTEVARSGEFALFRPTPEGR